MAFKHPEIFEPGNNPAKNWQKWKQNFEFYMEAEELSKKPVTQQRSTLLYLIGPQGLELYNTFTYVDEDGTEITGDALTTEIILNSFTDHFRPFNNVTYARYKLFMERQKPDQTIDEFVTILRVLARDCELQSLTDDLITHCIIIGIQNEEIKRKLLKIPNLQLSKAIDVCRAEETCNKQILGMNGDGTMRTDVEVNRIKFKRNEKIRNNPNLRLTNVCSRCLTKHKPMSCPAWGKICLKCKRRNHFASACRNPNVKKQVHDVEEYQSEYEEEEEDSYCISEVKENIYKVRSTSFSKSNDWVETAVVNNLKIKFKMDSGSQANTIPLNFYNKLIDKPKIQQTNKSLCSYTNHKIPIIGIISLPTTLKGKTLILEYFVMANNSTPLLSLKSMEKFGLINRRVVCEVEVRQSNARSIIKNYTDVFSGLGKLDHTYHIKLEEDAVPSISSARKIPYALKAKVKAELDRMVKDGVLKRIEEPTEWVHPIVIAKKSNGKIRICMDPRKLNQFIKREHYQLPIAEDILSEIGNSKIFTVLDASSAFLQIPLDEASTKLCTIATPYGRYCFQRLPYGMTSSPEVWQKAINQILEGIEGVFIYLDDILIVGSTPQEHDERLKLVLDRARKSNLKLNKEKTQLAVRKILFLGHDISSEGISINKAKIEAIMSMKPPLNIKELQRFLGMIKYLGKFIPNVSEKTEVLRQLLRKDVPFNWEATHQKCFETLKKNVTSAPTLALFNPKKEITLSVDASQYGLGSVMLQDGKPIAFASSTLTPAQTRYAQIEKELLAIVTACEHFKFYTIGQSFTVQTDHKPLVGLLKKPLENLTPRLQALALKLLRFNPKIEYVPGKYLYVADLLSRSPQDKTINTEYLENGATKVYAVISASPEKTTQLISATAADETLNNLKRYIESGWPPNKNKCSALVKPYWDFKDEIVYQEGLLYKGNRLIIPACLRQEFIKWVHKAHQGINACIYKARQAYYWPGMYYQITQVIEKCSICIQYARSNSAEPLIPHPVENLPWSKVGMDFAHINNEEFLVLIDYHSEFIIVDKLILKTASSVINKLKNIFSHHGIPQVIMTDNGPPFNSGAWNHFLKSLDIQHLTSSPNYPISNGLIERTVQTVKSLLIKARKSNTEPFLVIMEHNTTPKNGKSSPAERLMGRQLNTSLLVPREILIPKFDVEHTVEDLSQKQSKMITSQKPTKPLSSLNPGQTVAVQEKTRQWTFGKVLQSTNEPRSYKVKMDNGAVLRRNRRHLRPANDAVTPQEMNDKGPAVISRTSPFPRAATPQADQNNEPYLHKRIRRKPSFLKDYVM